MKKDKKASKKAKPEEVASEATQETKKVKVNKDLTDAVKKAQKKLEAYMTENKLDPTKDYSKDKKHGAKIRELVAIINVAQGKVTDAAPKEAPNTKPKGCKVGVAQKYDYPLVDGKEMTADEKKKYRSKQRALAAGKGEDKPKKEKVEKEKSAPVEKDSKKEVKKDASKKDAKAPKKEDKKKDKNKDKKKVKKDED